METIRIRKSVARLIELTAVIFMVSCIFAIPVAIKYAKGPNKTEAKAELPAPADKVYTTSVTMAEERNLTILKRDDEKRFLEVTDGVQTGSVQAEPAGKNKTELTVVASLPPARTQDELKQKKETKEEKKERIEKEKDMTLRIVDRICERLEIKCKIKK